MKYIKLFEGFLAENKIDFDTEDVFFLWDEFFDDDRQGIQSGHIGKGEEITFDFNSSRFGQKEVNAFKKKLADKLSSSNSKFEWDNNKLIFLK